MEIVPYALKINAGIQSFDDAIMQRFRSIISMDLTAIIEQRVLTGKNKDGGGWKPYAEKTKDIRRKAGKETEFKNFEFTGEMWRKFGEKSSSKTEKTLSVTIGGTNADSQMKIDDNSEREGMVIIEPSQSEIDTVEGLFVESIDDYLTNVFRG